MMFVAAAMAILVTMGMAIARIMAGPTLYDRILATNVFGTKTVLLTAVLSFIAGRPELVDIAIVYALINFIGIVAVLKFFEQQQPPGVADCPEPPPPRRLSAMTAEPLARVEDIPPVQSPSTEATTGSVPGASSIPPHPERPG